MLRSEILNCFDLILLGLGSCLGVGVFVLLGDVSKNVVGPAIIISIVIAGITALLAGMCYAEFGVLHLNANSVYVYSYSIFNENAAFIFGWAIIVQYVAEIASAAKGIILFVDGAVDNKILNFLKEVVPMNFFFTGSYFDFASLCLIIALMTLKAFGVKNFLLVKKIFTAGSVALLILIIIAGSFKADSNNWNLEKIPETEIEGGFIPFGFCGVIKGAALMFYGFTGFEEVGISGNEVEQIQKNLPIATLISLLVAMVGYMGVGALLTLMIPYYKLNSYAALPLAFDQVELNWMKWLIIFGVFFAFQTSLFSAMHFLSQIITAMANDSLLFPFLGVHNSKTKITVPSIVVGGLISAAAAAIFSFEQLVNLTVAAALFVCTVLALGTIFLRYTSKIKEEGEGKLSENHSKLFTEKKSFLKMIAQNFYELTFNNVINVTEKIVYWNLFFFCFSSIGLSIIFIIFTDSLLKCALEAILPACAFLIIMLFNLFIIYRQHKINKNLPYKIPFVPITPCLSIFLNTFLMVSLDTLSWSMFLIWMILGIIPYLFWTFLKRCKKQIREPSHYKINRINVIKLNESIWKIKLQKKSFYEGAVNPAFSEEGESSFTEMQSNLENKTEKKHAENISLQIKQAEIIQTADLVVTEKVEPLTNECQSKYMNVNNIEIETSECLQSEDEGVLWQCVAEIHAKEDFPQESVVLEIVDNSYNFLSEGAEEIIGDENLLKNSFEESKEAVEAHTLRKLKTKGNDKLNIKLEESLIPNFYSPKYLPPLEDSITKKTMNCNPAFKEELLQEVCKRMNTRHKNFNQQRNSKFLKPIATNDIEFETTADISSDVKEETNQTEILNLNTSNESKDQNEVDILILETLYEASKSEIIYNFMNNRKENLEIKESITKQDEQKKIKEFKEKLNQLLKDQVINSSVSKALTLSKPNNKMKVEKEDSLMNPQENDGIYKSIKTLNKSQIKNKLELLLSKGPPKRPSLKNSFNLELKENNNNQAEKLGDEGMMKILKQNEISDEKSSKLLKDEIDLLQENDPGKKILLGIEN